MPGLDVHGVALRYRRTRIVATLGPATPDLASIRALLEAGVDVVRLNFSHGDAATHAARAGLVRRAARSLGRHVPILADLSGPKIRCGCFIGGAIELADGERVVVTTRPTLGRPGLIPSGYPGLARDVRAGQRLLLDDGKLELVVDSVRPPEVVCCVVHGGTLRDRKGINLPDTTLGMPSLTAKDRKDAVAALAIGVDYMALSFVRSARDVRALRSHLGRHGGTTPIIAKIEKPQALDAIAAIVEESDAIMVARGDLGVELAMERVPIVQRELVRFALERNRPVIVATQMLESMIESATPTRAEVGDVANVAFTGGDAVMLSAETATGRHPIAAVRAMDRILREVEGYQWAHGRFAHTELPVAATPDEALLDAVGRAAAQLSRDLDLRCIVVPTRSGVSARNVAADRPAAPVVAVTSDERVCRRAALLWGVIPVLVANRDFDNPEATARRAATALGLARPGDQLLLIQALDPDPERGLPTLKIVRV